MDQNHGVNYYKVSLSQTVDGSPCKVSEKKKKQKQKTQKQPTNQQGKAGTVSFGSQSQGSFQSVSAEAAANVRHWEAERDGCRSSAPVSSHLVQDLSPQKGGSFCG